MNETFAPTRNQPGAMAPVDLRLEALLAINLLDEEPEPSSPTLEPPRFQQADNVHERIPVLAG